MTLPECPGCCLTDFPQIHAPLNRLSHSFKRIRVRVEVKSVARFLLLLVYT